MVIETNISISDKIEEYISTIPGWTPFDELLSLFHLAFSTSNMGGDVLEIGSWCGRSTAVLALACQMTKGNVHAVDLFPHKHDWYRNDDGSYSFRVDIDGRRKDGYNEQTVWAEPFERDIAPIYEQHESILDFFWSNLRDAGVHEAVTAFRGNTDMYFSTEGHGKRYRLAFIDGDHSRAAVSQDIRYVEEALLPGGWIAFDDAFSCYDGVDAAIRDLVIDSGHYCNHAKIARKFFIAQKKG